MIARALLIVHVPADRDGTAHLAAATLAYPSMEVVALEGYGADVDAFEGRDVVLWPYGGQRLERAHLRGLEGRLSRVCSRLRVIAPASEFLGPGDLNGHDPVGWARDNLELVPPQPVDDLSGWFNDEGPIAEPEPEPIEATHERVADWQPPGMLEGEEQPDPVDLFEQPAIPALTRSMLPQAISAFVFDQSEIIGCDPAILAISTLVACAAATSDAHRLQPKEFEYGWKESARLWGAFVGDPSVKKTPPLNRAMAPLRKIDADFAERGEEAIRRYKIAKKVYDAREKRYIDASAKNQPQAPLEDPPERPPQRRIIVQDATIEAVADVLADNPEGILVLFDELAGFFGSMDAYRAQAGKDRSFWLESYNGGPRRVDRISREARSVPNLSTCILGGIQPAAIRDRAKDMVDDGLLQRFMIVIAKPGHSVGEDRRADTEASALYRGILEALVRDNPSTDEPMTLEPGARTVMKRVEVRLDELTRDSDLPLRMRYQLGKWSGLFVRLCLTFHAIECAAIGWPIAGSVPADIAERVESFMFRFLFWHLQHFYEAILGDSTGEVEVMQRVAMWILAAAPERFTSWHVSRGVSAWRSSTWNLRRNVLDRLENCGWIVRLRAEHPSGAMAWRVNLRTREVFSGLVDAEVKRRENAHARIVGEGRKRAESE